MSFLIVNNVPVSGFCRCWIYDRMRTRGRRWRVCLVQKPELVVYLKSEEVEVAISIGANKNKSMKTLSKCGERMASILRPFEHRAHRRKVNCFFFNFFRQSALV